MENTIFHKFDKLLFLCEVGEQYWVIVEIRKAPKKLILIHDPSYSSNKAVCESLSLIFRRYIAEELRDK